MHPNLSFDQAPPVSVPVRFFLTAPLFGIAAGMWLIWRGEAAWVSRWGVDVLALMHLFSVGFMLQVMCGALMQFVPVATGGNLWHPRVTANWVHPLLTLGAISLVLGFINQQPIFFRYATYLLMAGLSVFWVVLGIALFRTPARGATLGALRLAWLGLAITLILGLMLATLLGGYSGFAGLTDFFEGAGWKFPGMVNVHAAWGLAGWSLMLVMGVSYFVVPMFQLTPYYSEKMSRILPWGLFFWLLLWSIHLLFNPLAMEAQEAQAGQGWLLWVAYAIAAGYAWITLRLQYRRRRKVTDVTFLFWQVAMAILLAMPLLWFLIQGLPGLSDHPRVTLGLGVLLVWGFFVSVMCGMLYKIIPFLIWLQLQNMGILKLKIVPPNMKQMIPERMMQAQFIAHFLTIALLLAATAWPGSVLVRLAGGSMVCSLALFEWNLVGAVRLYADYRQRILAQPA